MNPIQILLAEDELMIAEDIQINLEELGYHVVQIVTSGEEAVASAAKLHPDIVLMDIMLKGEMDGIHAAQLIRSQHNIPVVYLTSYSDKETLERAKITEPFGFILKPFHIDGLQSTIEMALYKHRMEQRLSESEGRMRQFSAHLQAIREQERTYVAREIHDELGQALTALKMDLSWLRSHIDPDADNFLIKISSMTQLIDQTLSRVKKISTELRPGLLDDLGLGAAIEWQAGEFQNRTSIQCNVHIEPEDVMLDEQSSTAIFRILQEALTNVIRHAEATTVSISLIQKDGSVTLTVEDNGKGITRSQIENRQAFGLIGIRERVDFLGGEVSIGDNKGKGTTIQVRIPTGKGKPL